MFAFPSYFFERLTFFFVAFSISLQKMRSLQSGEDSPVAPFNVLSWPELLSLSVSLTAAERARPLRSVRPPFPPPRHIETLFDSKQRRIRLGFLSGDFREHPVTQQVCLCLEKPPTNKHDLIFCFRSVISSSLSTQRDLRRFAFRSQLWIRYRSISEHRRCLSVFNANIKSQN